MPSRAGFTLFYGFYDVLGVVECSLIKWPILGAGWRICGIGYCSCVRF
jgi:hypothetical protein